MLNLPSKFIILDSEYTAWEGSEERGWSGKGEYREIVQLAAIKVGASRLQEIDSFNVYVKPAKNSKLSDYFINLTGITQAKVDVEGIGFEKAIEKFFAWRGNLAVYCFGDDDVILQNNYELIGIKSPFSRDSFVDIRKVFMANGIDARQYNSGAITKAFGVKPRHRGHNALADVRTILDGLRLLKKSHKS